MRFSTTALLALPLLASAAESPFEQYRAKFQNFLSSFGASTPGQPKADAPAVGGAAPGVATGGKGSKTKKVAEPKKIDVLTLENWKDTLYGPVRADAAQPAEWLVLVSGRNKTCFGRCERIDTAFTESAVKFASLPPSQPSPQHLARVNCDDTPVLCNAWSANAGAIWLFEVPTAPGAVVEIHTRRMNLTTVTAQDIVDAYAGTAATNRTEAGWHRFDPNGWFHPIEGKFAKYGLAMPLGYTFWALNAIPSWGMMLIVSFLSRSMMNRRMEGMNRPAGAPGAGPRAAPAGDARS
ncbi:hypothetical protein N657DRAFT_575430 [Parathielavia appendiculata]|uniref:Peptidyl-trna hydrolase n=1 Tax=Parathielavia appendiculata TaxID=2587402 RepID=A0AAN6TYA5_9PEZI|nr:hypothetical protein N657DRAFT_575430 [Parathielavia appendiculata]